MGFRSLRWGSGALDWVQEPYMGLSSLKWGSGALDGAQEP